MSPDIRKAMSGADHVKIREQEENSKHFIWAASKLRNISTSAQAHATNQIPRVI